jgi:hypothetical protein
MLHMAQMASNPGKNTVVLFFGPRKLRISLIEATIPLHPKLNNVVGF